MIFLPQIIGILGIAGVVAGALTCGAGTTESTEITEITEPGLWLGLMNFFTTDYWNFGDCWGCGWGSDLRCWNHGGYGIYGTGVVAGVVILRV